ncbi:MAG: YifB family Mg chelatase-like AAA ATPase [Alphaproteobacteria bacterium]|nr:YifB family Mg chelatase-like AAA ATPase [Alphaproteobacteria bacterium]
MLATTYTVAFSGVDVLKISTEVQLTNGLPSFSIVGLADKAIAESRERVRAALYSLGLTLPAQHITVNLAPADVVKEGTHYDLPIAMALMGAMGVIEPACISSFIMMGELGLDGSIRPVSGVLPAGITAHNEQMGLICSSFQSTEASWAEAKPLLTPPNLLHLINYFKNHIPIPSVSTQDSSFEETNFVDLKEIKGQEIAKRALEIAAVGGHNLLMIGPPGSGKSMLASRLPSILPPMSKNEILEVSQIHSIAGKLKEGKLITSRPYRSPHHSATMPSLVGGGSMAKPGEISLAHRGILFLDELPEFNRTTLESLRQPMETGYISVSRANAHITYPARFQLIAAMNPCRCGYLGTPGHECSRSPKCGLDYQAKLSGPLLDRIDLQIEVPAVHPWELAHVPSGEESAVVRQRVQKARLFALHRFEGTPYLNNAQADGSFLEKIAHMDTDSLTLLQKAAEQLRLSARGYHRIIRIARTIADMNESEQVLKIHVTEALSFRNPLQRN